MKVFELMTTDPGVCHLDDNLTRAAEIMWQRDCGAVPVVDEGNRVVGMITDRDICIAVASRDKSPSQIRAREMNFRAPVACAPDDDVKDALKKMRKAQIKRVIVASETGELAGLISLSDILHKGADKKSVRKQILKTFEAISSPAPIVLREADADETDESESDLNF